MVKAITRLALLCLVLLTVPVEATGPAQPAITITQAPICGVDDDVMGQTFNVVPADYEVAVYIWVGVWWTKPTFDQPTLPIDPDGSWGGDIWSHPNDLGADRIRVFLVPAAYDPPQADGDPMLAAELFDFPHFELVRQCESRHVLFSNVLWRVKDSGDQKVGPGPNYFSDDSENVSVDENGHLHVKITNRDGKWQSAEVIHGSPDPEALGYGTYVFQVRGTIDVMDPFVVLGLFTWDSFAPEFNYREIDVEIARWGNAADPTNAQYVVQPYFTEGNLRRFTIDEPGEITTTHTFEWTADGVEFRSWYGDSSVAPTPLTLIDEWSYVGGDTPPAGEENARVNLWLMSGIPPSNGQEYELILEKYEFYAAGPPGSVPGGSLVLGKNPVMAGDLDLLWDAACTGAEDYAIYEGDIGFWSGHVPCTCTTGGSTAETIGPANGSRYYLVVPLSETSEGGYGDGSSGARPRSTDPCRPLSEPLPCS
jgi:hypothetical protein